MSSLSHNLSMFFVSLIASNYLAKIGIQRKIKKEMRNLLLIVF